MIRIQRTGAWTEYADTLVRAGKSLPSATDLAIVAFAGEVRDHLKEGIRRGLFVVPALTDRYADAKGSKHVFVNSGGYVGAIGVVKDSGGYRVGFATADKAPSGAKYEDIAVWLEYGTSRMAPRPHWRPTLEWAKTQAPQSVGKPVLDALHLSR